MSWTWSASRFTQKPSGQERCLAPVFDSFALNKTLQSYNANLRGLPVTFATLAIRSFRVSPVLWADNTSKQTEYELPARNLFMGWCGYFGFDGFAAALGFAVDFLGGVFAFDAFDFVVMLFLHFKITLA